jgi:hypothetical protein
MDPPPPALTPPPPPRPCSAAMAVGIVKASARAIAEALKNVDLIMIGSIEVMAINRAAPANVPWRNRAEAAQ